jgi:hypothetical protein
MKNYFLYSFFAVCLFKALPDVLYAQSIGITLANTYARVNQLSFNKQAIDIEAYQVRDLGSRIGLSAFFEYPVSSTFRLRTEIAHYRYGYELRQDFGYDSYWANGFGFRNIQLALIAEGTLFRIGESAYFALHSGAGFNDVASNRIYMGFGNKRTPLRILQATKPPPPPFSTTTMRGKPRPPLENYHTTNFTLLVGASFNIESRKGKFSVGCTYNYALQDSPQMDMDFSLEYNGELTEYKELLHPKIHFLNFYLSYAWFLKAREKEKKARK